MLPARDSNPASQHRQTHALDRAATRIGTDLDGLRIKMLITVEDCTRSAIIYWVHTVSQQSQRNTRSDLESVGNDRKDS